MNIAVLVSGGGTNLQAIIDAIDEGRITNGRVVCVISSREDAYALERAKKHGIPAVCVPRKAFGDTGLFCGAIREKLAGYGAELVVLAGFLSILDEQLIKEYRGRIINVHPALIPAFSGKGCYGLRVHEMALERGVKITGATVHFVNEGADEGPIILQKTTEVREDDTPEALQKRVMRECEQDILPRAVDYICNGKVLLENGRVRIRD